MWLNAYGASNHRVYIGTNKAKVTEATPKSPEHQEKITEDGNVHYLKESLKSGTMYCWRVDAELTTRLLTKETCGRFKRREHRQPMLNFK